MAGIKSFRTVAVAACALVAAPPAVEWATAQDGDLRIVVIEGEDSVNIIAQGTAVPTLVEVRDRNDLPVSGASVLFLLGRGRRGDTERGRAAGGVDDERAGAGGGDGEPAGERSGAAVGERDVSGADGGGDDRADELRNGG